MAELKTDYKDQLLDSLVNTKRVYNLVDADGNVVRENVSLEDVTVYSQDGDNFGAADINKTNEMVNQVNRNFVYDENGIYGYVRKVDGADTVIPFSSIRNLQILKSYSTRVDDNNGKFSVSGVVPSKTSGYVVFIVNSYTNVSDFNVSVPENYDLIVNTGYIYDGNSASPLCVLLYKIATSDTDQTVTINNITEYHRGSIFLLN